MTFEQEWERCRPWLEAALAHSVITHTIDDVKVAIESGEMQLWPGQNAALVTTITHYPRADICSFFLAGGNLDEILFGLEPHVCAWAKAKGCKVTLVAGRKGWERVLGPNGYTQSAMLLAKEL